MINLSIDCRLCNNSGIGRYIKDIVPNLLDDPSWSVELLKDLVDSLPDAIGQKAPRCVNVYSSYYSISEQFEIPYKVSKKSLLWVPHYNFPVLRRGKTIATVHDVAHLALKNSYGGILKNAYAQYMFNKLSQRVDKIIAVSEFTKNELIKYVGINEDKIKVIYNGLEEEWHYVSKEKNPEDQPYFLYVGNVKPHKNLKTLVKAFLYIRDDIPHNLVIVGQKEGFITKDEEIDSLIGKVSDRIKFTGFISDELLKQYYKHAGLFVFPSLYEGFGYPPLEAMACGTPVIASNTASIPEVCEDAAIYFEPTDVEELAFRIENVISSEELKQELIQKGKRQSKKFTVEKCVTQTANVLKSLM